jgi:hypothetical protein
MLGLWGHPRPVWGEPVERRDPATRARQVGTYVALVPRSIRSCRGAAQQPAGVPRRPRRRRPGVSEAMERNTRALATRLLGHAASGVRRAGRLG